MENFELAKQCFYEGVAHLERAEYALAEARFNESLKQVPDRVSTLTNLASALIKQDKIGAAKDICLKVLSIENDSPEGWLNLGLVQAKEGDHVEALKSFDRVAAGDTEFAEVWLNKGISLRELARHEEAAACLRQSIGIQPANAVAHFNLGLTLEALDQTDSALTSYSSAIGIDPGFMAAKYQIFSLHLANLADVNLIERLGAEFAAGWSRRQIDAIRRHRELSDFRMLHELEQTGYLLGLGYESEALVRVNACLQKIYTENLAERGHSVATQKIPLSAGAVEDIVRHWENPVRYTISSTIGSCLNSDKNWHEVEEQYFSSSPEMIVIDDFLSPEALTELRKFCLVSTVWKKEFRKQYLGAFPEDGFVSPLHVRIADELKRKMPRVLGPHRLEQTWGFKYTSRMGGGINVHADFARVNMNFWITPDEANLDPASGGLVVYDTPCPPSWGFREYNQDEKAIYAFLEKHGARSTRVPYKCNRAVLFNSSLFHETDKIEFREGYENRRINITYLFGKGLKTH